MADINVISSLKVNNAAPADAKYIVKNIAGLQSIINDGNAYEGMQCFNQEDHKLYILYTNTETNELNYKELLGDASADISALQQAVTTLNGDAEVIGSVAKAIKDEADRAKKAEKANTDAITVLNGDNKTEGSVKKSIADAIDVLAGDVTSDDNAYVTVEVKTENGQVSDVIVTNKDETLRRDITALQATHATKENGSYKTVAEEAAEAAAAIVDSAPEAFDTLKEIANWINDSDVSSEGFNAAKRITDLQKAVGVEAAGETAATGLVKDVRDLQEAVGATAGSVETQIVNKINELDATVGEAEVAEGNHVAVQVVEEDGKITAVNVSESDIASAALLGTKADNEEAETAFGYIAKAQAAADAAQDDVNNLKTLVGALPEDANVETVVAYAAQVAADKANTAKNEAIDSAKEHFDKLEGTGEGSVYEAKKAADAAQKDVNDLQTLVGQIPEEATATTIVGYAKEVADAAASDASDVANRATALEALHSKNNEEFKTVNEEITEAIDNLNAEAVTSTDGAKVSVTVSEAKGLITGVTVTETDIASAQELENEIARAKAAEKANADAIGKAATDNEKGTGLTGRIEVLEGLTGKTSVQDQIDEAKKAINTDIEAVENRLNTIEGAGDGSIKKAVADGIAGVLAGADEKFDTLKEVADWILSDTNGAAKMQTTINTLISDDTISGSVANSIKTKLETLDKEVSSTDGNGITVTVSQENGLISAVNVENTFKALTTEEIDNLWKNDTDTTETPSNQ